MDPDYTDPEQAVSYLAAKERAMAMWEEAIKEWDERERSWGIYARSRQPRLSDHPRKRLELVESIKSGF